MVVAGPSAGPCRLLLSSCLLHRTHRGRRAHTVRGAALLSPPRSAGSRLGLRVWGSERAHAGHCRGLRAADSIHFWRLPRRPARAALAVRPSTPLPSDRRRPNLAEPLRAARDARATHRGCLCLVAAGANRNLPAVQLRHPHCPAGADAMKPIEVLTQMLELVAALAAAPLFLGWVNQCRAWLQNRRAPSIWMPYRNIRKLFDKDAVLAENASPLF